MVCVNEAKNLGLIIDLDIRFKERIKNCIKKAFSKLKNIYTSRKLLDKQTLLLLCNSLVLSILIIVMLWLDAAWKLSHQKNSKHSKLLCSSNL